MHSHITQSVCDMNRNKLCDLYDSQANPEGQATDIKVTSEQNGWKEINFTLPRKVNGAMNHRWDYIRSEYLLRYTKGSFVDWYVIHAPNKQRGGLTVTNAVKSSHLSSQQNKRNLYFEFDDENGIGTIETLIRQALTGTGWTLGSCDTFYEADGTTAKVRSMSTTGKRGAYLLIQDICKLFHARPVFHGDTRIVDIHALEARDGLLELNYGKNLKSLERKENSENIVTRLYVEGEYGDYGYVGIDEVNPTGLSFLLDFSYYRQLGSFTDAHQAALDRYLPDIRREKVTASRIMEQIITLESRLNSLWGQYNYMLYVVEGGKITRSLSGGTVMDDKREQRAGDSIVVLLGTDKHEYREYLANMPLTGITHIVKYITKPAGIIGGKEVAVESKEQSIESLSKLRDKVTTDAKRDEYQRQIDDLRTGIALLMNGDTNGPGLYALMREAVLMVIEMADRNRSYEASLGRQNEIEAEFAFAMGDMLRDGYYSDSNYTVGQAEFLYRDALDMMAVLARPEVKYSVTALNLAHLAGYEQEEFQLNMALRLYDDELEINDYAYITKLEEHPATPWEDKITISNDAQEIGNKTLESILTRINEIAALIEQKQALYERARAIGADGSIPLKRLEGTIDVLKTRLTSAVSNWYTDDSGNLVLESLDGRYAMKLCGEGFMIAAGRNDQGNWDWRTFGTGEGFTADLIVAGYLSADRIEAESITANKLASDVGRSLDLSSNTSINLAVSNTVKETIGYRVEIEADRGTVLSEYVPALTLSARVWNGNEDVAAKTPASRFVWTRKSADPTADAQWNQAHIAVKSVTVTTMDVYLSATFECAVQDA